MKLHNDSSVEGHVQALILVLGPFAELRKAAVSFVMSVRPSAWNNSAPTIRIFMTFDI